MKRKNYLYRRLFYLLMLFLCVSFAAYFYYRITLKKTDLTFNYTENSNIDYKVYLNDNSFFENEYLTKDELNNNDMYIITELINYINLNYSYNISFSENITGNYTYYLKGTLSALKTDGTGNYWSKDYIFTDPVKTDINDTNTYSFFANLNVDYNKYNEMLNDFKREFNISTEGNLDISLIVETNIKNEGFKDSSLVSSGIKATIPLTKMSTKINIDAKNGNKSGSFTEQLIDDNKIYYVFNALMATFVIASFVFVILLIIDIKKYKEVYQYYRMLDDILTSYDGIIVNIDRMPDISEYNVIPVQSFEELIDAHSEIRMPINYYSKGHVHTFMLANDNMMWIYEFETKKVKVKR